MVSEGPECDQALFGWVEKKGQLGHQLISTSSGVTGEEISYLQRWNLPVSISNVKFKEGIRFFQIGAGRYCLNLVKNIGKDLQGREGALMSHFIILDREALHSIKGDFASMDSVLLHSVSSLKDLEKLRTKDGDFYQLPKVRFKPSQDGGKDAGANTLKNELTLTSLTDIFYAMIINLVFPRIRLLVVTEGPESKYELIWTLLRLFPMDLRYISHSTSLYNVRDDLSFSISLVSSASQEEFDGYSIVSLDGTFTHIPSKNEAAALLSNYVASLVFSGKHAEISAYQNNFTRIDREIAAPHRLFLSLSDSFLSSNAALLDKIKVALEASEIELQREGKYLRLLKSLFSSLDSNGDGFRIVSAFYADRIRSLQGSPDARKKVSERMLDLMLLSGTGVDYLTVVLKDLLNTLKSDAALDLARCTVERIMAVDLSVEDFSKVISTSEIMMKTFISIVRDGKLPKGGIKTLAMILENAEQEKVLWQYLNGFLDDKPGLEKIIEFINAVFNSEVMEVLGHDRVVKILKRMPKVAKGLDPKGAREVMSSILRLIHVEPLSKFLSQSQLIDMEFVLAEKGVIEDDNRNTLTEGRKI
ncbi:MAG: hypothetical protein QW597_06455 [Thermoplasmataceae archaeon]